MKEDKENKEEIGDISTVYTVQVGEHQLDAPDEVSIIACVYRFKSDICGILGVITDVKVDLEGLRAEVYYSVKVYRDYRGASIKGSMHQILKLKKRNFVTVKNEK